ncbi:MULTISPECIES: thermonuclease family protein [unclassified Rhizobium]|uniref:thermonuclease family protein n=1 Tax=unclassified Rhizobium TaxID=2613769 RepID=UPI00161DA8CF|nr:MULTISPECIES: thermonuclease family protein [unclassified Rhizobium]MBB3385998.1 endonuclease YncB(thermonuclease family) [Rhizobium sp. BK098]MBB3617825.1 endonuclease YncB(thermonuclease family) [Rhizobium sp. BK609]MBB3683360.1 endonuclease YncB(thermonuclease family) [Rhizobium sp. BK612]
MPTRALLFLSVTLLTSPVIAADLVGRASVIDGDTIEIQGARIRLQGIDAPESWQICVDQADRKYQCGRAAALALDAWLARSRPTRCTPSGHDRYRRTVATCFRADGAEVNRWLVQSGYAVDWPKYSHGLYQEAQYEAMAAERGIWNGYFDLPCQARAKRDHGEAKC